MTRMIPGNALARLVSIALMRAWACGLRARAQHRCVRHRGQIGIFRDTPDGGVGSAHRISPVRSAGHYRRPTAQEAQDYYRRAVVDNADWAAVDNILAMKMPR